MYEDKKCPYCGKFFHKDDDIVVCPECGVPHHRACWMEHNICANAENHGLEEQVPEEDFVAEFQQEATGGEAEDPEEKGVCKRCGAKLINGASHCLYCGQEVGKPVYVVGRAKDNSGKDPLGGVPADATIADKPILDVAETIRSKTDVFLPIFYKLDNRKNKLSWNWCAFLFGYFYFFFRKMYKFGVILIIASILTVNLADIAFGSPIGNFQSKVTSAAESSFTNGAVDSEKAYEQAQKLQSEVTGKDYAKMAAVIAVKILIINVGSGLLANYLYMKSRIGVINKINRSAEIIGEMSKKDYHFNLVARGGTSILAIILAYFANSIIQSLLAYLIEMF